MIIKILTKIIVLIEYKINNEYEENNKIKDFHEIIIRFKLNSEEYKLLLKEKAKLINPFN